VHEARQRYDSYDFTPVRELPDGSRRYLSDAELDAARFHQSVDGRDA
jgi:hypothetical protein